MHFAESASRVLTVPLDIKTEVTNNFSFELNANKFKDIYNFEFAETAETIIKSLVDNYEQIEWSLRTGIMEYA
jgi:hypothetical protein